MARAGSFPPCSRRADLPTLLGLLVAGGLSSCTGESGSKPAPAPFPQFIEVARSSGIRFQHVNGFDGLNYRVVETVNGGLALLDYNGDGSIDIYFTNGRRIDPGPHPARDALYRNNGDFTFSDITAAAGLGDDAMSLGSSVADIDGDGDPDLLVTNWGPNRLYRNNGDGTFTDIAGEAGLGGSAMHSGSAFLDMDHDGDLDLYMAVYTVEPEVGRYHPYLTRGVPGYHPPRDYPAPPHFLYENRGGRFVDVSEASGIRAVEPGRGLGVISADFNGDTHPDIYVANDTTANFMFLGDGRGRFREVGFQNGTAYGEEGGELGSMGVDVGDYDGDGLSDLCVTNYQNQINNLYRARVGGELYEDRARPAGTAVGNLPEVAWGVGLVDLDNDGWRDLFVSNGHLNPLAHEIDGSTTYLQRKRVFRNAGAGGFEDVSLRAGEALRTPRVSRGAAFGDLDNDGDLDIVVNDSIGSPEVLRNEGGNRGNWVLVRLIGSGMNRDAIGARVTVEAGGRSQWAERRSSASYLSSNDHRLHFGLGRAKRIERLEVRWPGGPVEVHRRLEVNRLLTIKKDRPRF